jgi:hypothetical protein
MTRRDSRHQILAGGFIGCIQRKQFESLIWSHKGAQSVSFFLDDVGCDHGRALMQKAEGDGTPESSGAARDESDFGIEDWGHKISGAVYRV